MITDDILSESPEEFATRIRRAIDFARERRFLVVSIELDDADRLLAAFEARDVRDSRTETANRLEASPESPSSTLAAEAR